MVFLKKKGVGAKIATFGVFIWDSRIPTLSSEFQIPAEARLRVSRGSTLRGRYCYDLKGTNQVKGGLIYYWVGTLEVLELRMSGCPELQSSGWFGDPEK